MCAPKKSKSTTTIVLSVFLFLVASFCCRWIAPTTAWTAAATVTPLCVCQKRNKRCRCSLRHPSTRPAVTTVSTMMTVMNKLRVGDTNKQQDKNNRLGKSSQLFASSEGNLAAGGGGGGFRWTPLKALQAVAVFVLAGIAEIGGGWLVWMAVREKKPWWWALAGSLTMVVYAFLPTLQPTDSFGRVYAVYGGFFIALSYVWGYIFDGMKPDTGDILGGSLALLAVLIILFWPRAQQ